MWAGAMEKFGYGEVKLNVCLSNNIADILFCNKEDNRN